MVLPLFYAPSPPCCLGRRLLLCSSVIFSVDGPAIWDGFIGALRSMAIVLKTKICSNLETVRFSPGWVWGAPG